MENEALVVKCKSFLSADNMQKLEDKIRNDLKTGVVVLPYYCDAVFIAKDIEVRFAEADEDLGLAFIPIGKAFGWV